MFRKSSGRICLVVLILVIFFQHLTSFPIIVIEPGFLHLFVNSFRRRRLASSCNMSVPNAVKHLRKGWSLGALQSALRKARQRIKWTISKPIYIPIKCGYRTSTIHIIPEIMCVSKMNFIMLGSLWFCCSTRAVVIFDTFLLRGAGALFGLLPLTRNWVA